MDILSSKTITGNLFRKPELNWGILGTARINEKVIPAIQNAKHNNVQAIASRDLTRARAFADKVNVPVAYGSYDDLLWMSTSRGLYPLPNHEHMPWTIKALQWQTCAGRKPFALSADEATMSGQPLRNRWC